MTVLIDQLAVVAQKVEGFGPLVDLTQSSPNISPQALSILKQIFDAHCECVMEHKSWAGTNYLFIGAGRGQIEVDEPRFIDEDRSANGYTKVVVGLLTNSQNQTHKINPVTT